MEAQPSHLRRLIDDRQPAQRVAERLRGRDVALVGIGTSWHAAQHGAWLLGDAGVTATAVHAADFAPYGRRFDPDCAVIVLSHTGTTGFTVECLRRARADASEVVHISALGAGGDLETVPEETSYAYTASHTGALLRLAQIAAELGAPLGDLAAVPDAVAAVLTRPDSAIAPPARLIELVGAGPNAWTAQEGSLKIREAAYVAAEGLSVEQFFHGPSVALDEQDTLVVLDGGGPLADRTAAIADAVQATGASVVRFAAKDLGEPLSIFALTARVQRIALELAEQRNVSPDRFRFEKDPHREAAFAAVPF